MIRNLLRQHAAITGRPPAPRSLEEPDQLEAEHLQPLAAGHAGLPEATDSLAYDPVQHLLAVQIELTPIAVTLSELKQLLSPGETECTQAAL